MNFWFRFIYKYQSAIEIENFDYVKTIIRDDFETYSGKILEKYFIEKLKGSKQFNIIGHYWERGNKNEIDIIAVNERKKIALIAEVKRNEQRISLNQLKTKSGVLAQRLSDYKIYYNGLSLNQLFNPISLL